MSRYGFSLLPPNLPPKSTRSKSSASSPQHQTTFCTLDESVLPQILIIFPPSTVNCSYHPLQLMDSGKFAFVRKSMARCPTISCFYLLSRANHNEAQLNSYEQKNILDIRPIYLTAVRNRPCLGSESIRRKKTLPYILFQLSWGHRPGRRAGCSVSPGETGEPY